jgi:Arc/MetJ family transcription regulator
MQRFFASLDPPNFVIPNEVRDLHFAADCRSLTSFGMTIHGWCRLRRCIVKELINAMRTTIDIDDSLMRKAMRAGELTTTKKAVVDAALQLFIQTKSQVGMRRFRGKIKWEGNLDVSRRGREPAI